MELEHDHASWIARLRQIDHLLESTVPTLIRVAKWSADPSSGQLSMPLFLSERVAPPPKKYILVHAICSSTILRLNRVQRRFAWLSKEQRGDLKKMAEEMPKTLEAKTSPKKKGLGFLWELGSDLFGAMNPLTSSEVFWVFIRAGEKFAHSSVGFLSFFAILWALERRYPDRNEAGAGLEPSGPTATTTAKCLVAVNSLCDALMARAGYYGRASSLIAEIDKVAGKKGPHATWTFAVTLDRLAGTLFQLSSYTIISDDFVEAGKFLLEQTKELGPESDTTKAWKAARSRIESLLQKLEQQQKVVFKDSREVVDHLMPAVVDCLEPGGDRDKLREWCTKLSQDDSNTKYWEDHARAAENSRKLCADALEKLQEPFSQFSKLGASGSPSAKKLTKLLDALQKSNADVAVAINQSVAESVQWCRRIINEETARASAGNLTDFDPAGLISAVTIAQKWRAITTPEAEDAIRRSLIGGLDDGSWMRGQPMFLDARVLGMWPHTPDIVWMLATAVNSGPTITAADDKLLRFVDWLERTRTKFESKEVGAELQGWSSELDRLPNIIDFWNTSVSINALLEIRELIETRLWQISARRFTIIRGRRMEKVAPVDLGAMHGKRLHRRLMTMARLTELQDTYDEQDYAIVLHGPPGSSKTAIVEGLGAEMWRDASSERRIIRITPSDFTRRGEAELESEARFIFELLVNLRGVTILFDEIDDFLRQRTGEQPSFIQLITPAMLNRLQDLRDAAPRQEISFVIATNFVDTIEPALLRPGRVDAVIPLAYPDAWSRQAILEDNLKGKKITADQTATVLESTKRWPWSMVNKLTKEIEKKASGLTDGALENEIHLLGGRVQDTDYYYREPKRWQKYSAPLANEFVHLAFCESKDLAGCRATVSMLAAKVKEPRLEAMFDEQVTAEERA